MPDGPANPHGVGFCATETLLPTELEAQRSGEPSKSRVWKVKNPNVVNPLNGAHPALPLPPAAKAHRMLPNTTAHFPFICYYYGMLMCSYLLL